MKKVKDYSHACEILEKNPEAKPDVSMLLEKDQKAFTSLFELTIIIEAQNKLNEWSVDWSNHHQGKYYPWMDVEEDKSKVSGFGLSYYDDDTTLSGTIIGSRLVVGTSEEAEYIGREFIALYEDWFLI